MTVWSKEVLPTVMMTTGTCEDVMRGDEMCVEEGGQVWTRGCFEG